MAKQISNWNVFWFSSNKQSSTKAAQNLPWILELGRHYGPKILEKWTKRQYTNQGETKIRGSNFV